LGGEEEKRGGREKREGCQEGGREERKVKFLK